ncbi:hypothetical protein OIB37_11135 [Streptomyces sp. NBC_00820]|uniref:hypothetical protein n=1 Tax=Streptomyces sp. NBC_00820 TaxID=2975842 RepID=UPI002ED2513F|nr:hypothetical protein OIB37_11135 [Streptomyces sp. NBC_00820]
MGDIAMVVDGQWAVGAQSDRWWDEGPGVEDRIADGRRIELTVEELARLVDSRIGDAHRGDDHT